MKCIKAAVVLAIALCGCSGVDGVRSDEGGPVMGSPQQDDEEATAQIAQPLVGGTPGGAASVVGLMFRDKACSTANCTISICTGAIVSRHMVMTAGHCVTEAKWQTLSSGVFGGRGAVTYLDPRTATFKCLTRTSGSIDGACNSVTDTDFTSMNGLVDPSFVDDLPANTRHDLALLYMSANWPVGIDQTDSARMAFGSTRNGVNGTSIRTGDLFTAVGNGANGGGGFTAGTLRFDPDSVRVDSVGSGVITNKAGKVRVCGGDSGSPALILLLAGHPITAGVLSNSPTRADDFRAKTGTAQNWSQTETEIGFINQTMTLLNVPCTNVGYIIQSNIGMSVRECW